MSVNKPNILFLFTDDQRFDTLAAAGNPHIHTPNLDRLVRGGTCFSHAFIQGGSVAAVCMPSRAMLHSGRNLFEIEDAGQQIPEAHALLAETFRQAGYETFGTGKWHNGCRSYARSFSCGAEIFFGGMADHWNVPACHFDPAGQYESHRHPACPSPMLGNALERRCVDHVHFGCHSTDLIAGATDYFLESCDKGKPFFAYASFLAPHDPRTMPEVFLDIYRDVELPLPSNFLPEHRFDTGALRVRDELLEDFPRRPERIRQHLREYYAMISHIDYQVGVLLARLEARGLLERTLIVLAGDNGLALGQHGLMGKQSLYEHSVRVPLVLHGPDIPAGVVRDEMVFLYDVFPTLCDYTGLSVPASVSGRSFLPAGSGRDQLYLAYSTCQRAVRTRNHKLIEFCPEGSRKTCLFDLQNDPWEMNNLAEDPACSDLLEHLRNELCCAAEASGDLAHRRGREFWELYGLIGGSANGVKSLRL